MDKHPRKKRLRREVVSSRARAMFAFGTSVTLFTMGACGGSGSGVPNSIADALIPFGNPIAGLTGSESSDFQAGRTAFAEHESVEDGIGPVFNATSCGTCHAQGGLGGSSPDLGVSRVTRIGGIVSGTYSDLENLGGPVLQARSIKEFDPSFPWGGEVVPPEARFVSLRITTPLFGAGLIEAIPDETILARTRMTLPDGIRGVANFDLNPISGRREVGKFGWKAQHSDLTVFAGDAYLNEMGITTQLFPQENLPQGKALLAGMDRVGDPEDTEDSELFGRFMRFLAPPARKQPSVIANAGEAVFKEIGCSKCHVPSMKTGLVASSALSNQDVHLYSDLLLHRMGVGLADGIIQGEAKGDMFRTAPLWGLSQRKFFMHDGRAISYRQAILEHDGEAALVRDRYDRLPKTQQDSLHEFLNSL